MIAVRPEQPFPAAVEPRPHPTLVRVDEQETTFRPLSAENMRLTRGDSLVLNDAATFPASYSGKFHETEVEVRLTEPARNLKAWAILMGAGDHRTDTGLRTAPPVMKIGDRIAHEGGLESEVLEVAQLRLVRLRFSSPGAPKRSTTAMMFKVGEPIRYTYATTEHHLANYQTRYAGRPWAVEPPSAGLSFSHQLLSELQTAGVAVLRLTHAAGISATGDASLDRALPFPERFDVPAATLERARQTRRRGRRVIALGTSALRALESAHRGPRAGTTTLRFGPTERPRLANGLVTGLHEAGTSHFELLASFSGQDRVHDVHEAAKRRGLVAHEFGDLVLWRS